ncbi:hypothetical protein K443DRAFT_11034 [Laccaria amethystina LaAM-08-1]|uniref:Uncharacterized protein n=1 Tax=Laccaria amethystina LaAM-08-1 TaxID=1095629 RepID=A0A0C9XIA4_9AGAR|nr:hypothetical protein K443DRAFT_11034 [Laccaria amethystina LaAM-08-1]
MSKISHLHLPAPLQKDKLEATPKPRPRNGASSASATTTNPVPVCSASVVYSEAMPTIIPPLSAPEIPALGITNKSDTPANSSSLPSVNASTVETIEQSSHTEELPLTPPSLSSETPTQDTAHIALVHGPEEPAQTAKINDENHSAGLCQPRAKQSVNILSNMVIPRPAEELRAPIVNGPTVPSTSRARESSTLAKLMQANSSLSSRNLFAIDYLKTHTPTVAEFKEIYARNIPLSPKQRRPKQS